MKYIHYGSDKFSLEKFNPIKNINWIKPEGGLWASPVDSEEGWKNWCELEEFNAELGSYFEFTLIPSAKIYTVNSQEEVKMLVSNGFAYLKYITDTFSTLCIDFEKLSNEYDALFLTAEGQWATRMVHPYSLYGWDCESILILNEKAIII